MPATKSLRVVDDDRITALGLLIEAHASLIGVLARELEAETGLPLKWYEVLVRLGRSPEHRLRMSDLADAVSLTTSGVTRLADRIEEAGLIERQACPTDRRVAYVTLTPAGARALAEATPGHLLGIEKHFTALLSGRQLETLGAALRRIRDANAPGGA